MYFKIQPQSYSLAIDWYHEYGNSGHSGATVVATYALKVEQFVGEYALALNIPRASINVFKQMKSTLKNTGKIYLGHLPSFLTEQYGQLKFMILALSTDGDMYYVRLRTYLNEGLSGWPKLTKDKLLELLGAEDFEAIGRKLCVELERYLNWLMMLASNYDLMCAAELLNEELYGGGEDHAAS